jgi:hypothetical protein
LQKKKVVEIALVLSCLEKQLYETLKNAEPLSVDDVLEGFKTTSLTSEGRTLHMGYLTTKLHDSSTTHKLQQVQGLFFELSIQTVEWNNIQLQSNSRW